MRLSFLIVGLHSLNQPTRSAIAPNSYLRDRADSCWELCLWILTARRTSDQ
ncbi:hypothetical protein [Pseudanabaena yagii]|uniref:Uncharacterized protein n=1 Tax=Pseudanabaena yagii GIHE-NHR1 TaxID=2722753 RepID=A0ABX1M0J7_9CYAN|nr:hypothetical protein [Pseudanabaena yagii]NMF61018.1 hypothetical protein [Pseudanabaena yagii GIHE-NHR1]